MNVEVCRCNFQYFNCHRDEYGWGNTFVFHASPITFSNCLHVPFIVFFRNAKSTRLFTKELKDGCAVSRDLVCALLQLFFYATRRTGRGIYYSYKSKVPPSRVAFFCPSGHNVHSVYNVYLKYTLCSLITLQLFPS